jgi:hypothetical protein
MKLKNYIKKFQLLKITLHKLLKIYNWDGNRKEKIDKNKEKNREVKNKYWRNNLENLKGIGELRKDNYKEKNKNNNEKKLN